MQDIKPVKYKHIPSCRYRGWCNEGAESQTAMLETIDLAPKLGMNVFMLEFVIPAAYYTRYYDHPQNPTAKPEHLSDRQILQWKRQCEAEIAKRGLQFHDIGHGWTAEPFGISTNCGWEAVDESAVPEESVQYLAMIGGKRQLNEGRPMNTNFCMSNEKARKIFASYVADYAQNHKNADHLHVWLSDGVNNHCECEVCSTKTASDWYMMLMNDVDDELTARGLDTRIVFIVYVDTTWPPITERIRNPKRFSILLAPITRTYSHTVDENAKITLRPYERNKLTFPESLDEYFAYFGEWRKFWKGNAFSYEYHFWWHQYADISGIRFSRRISEDIKEYKKRGVNGIVEDGSQRSFFPSGIMLYTYARTLYDTSLTPEQIAEEYFRAAFGDGWQKFLDYFTRVGDIFDPRYFEGELSSDPDVSPYYNPDYARSLEGAEKIFDEGRLLVKEYYNADERLRTVSARLCEASIDFGEYVLAMTRAKAVGNDAEARRIFTEFRRDFGEREYGLRNYLDNFLYFRKAESIYYRTE